MTTVRVVYWTESSHPADRLKETFAAGGSYERGWGAALRQLRDLLESGDPDAGRSRGRAGATAARDRQFPDEPANRLLPPMSRGRRFSACCSPCWRRFLAVLALAACGEEEKETSSRASRSSSASSSRTSSSRASSTSTTSRIASTWSGCRSPPPMPPTSGSSSQVANEDEDSAHPLPEDLTSSTPSTRSMSRSPARASTRCGWAPRSAPRTRCRPPTRPPQVGPIKGSMVLFLIPDEAAENRPLELDIPGQDGPADGRARHLASRGAARRPGAFRGRGGAAADRRARTRPATSPGLVSIVVGTVLAAPYADRPGATIARLVEHARGRRPARAGGGSAGAPGREPRRPVHGPAAGSWSRSRSALGFPARAT